MWLMEKQPTSGLQKITRERLERKQIKQEWFLCPRDTISPRLCFHCGLMVYTGWGQAEIWERKIRHQPHRFDLILI